MRQKRFLSVFLALGTIALFVGSHNCFANVSYNTSSARSIAAFESRCNSKSQPGNPNLCAGRPSYTVAQLNNIPAGRVQLISTAPSISGVLVVSASGSQVVVPKEAGSLNPSNTLYALATPYNFQKQSWKDAHEGLAVATAKTSPVPIPSGAILLISLLMSFIGTGLQRQRVKCS